LQRQRFSRVVPLSCTIALLRNSRRSPPQRLSRHRRQRRAQPYRRGRADPLGLQLTQFALVTVDRVWELRCASEDETHQWMDGEPFSRVPQCSCRSPIVE
jgi:hypothetical protein